MNTTRAAVLVEPRRFEVRTLPLPDVAADDAILRVEANGICGSDYELFEDKMPETPFGGIRFPFIPGHEPVGTIEEIGAEAAARWDVHVGDRVAVSWFFTCGRCHWCRTRRGVVDGHFGWPTGCAAPGALGGVPLDRAPGLWGGYAEHLYLGPGTQVRKLDRAVPPEIACMFNPLAAGFAWAVDTSELTPGQSIAILGAGQRGLASVIAARRAGASFIAVTGLARDAHKLDVARALGVDLAIDIDRTDAVEAVRGATRGRGVDVVLDTTPYSTSAAQQAIDMVAVGGTVTFAGIKAQPAPLSVDQIITKSLRVKGANGVSRRAFHAAIDLVESGEYDLSAMHTHSFGLAEADLALRVLTGEVLHERGAIHVAIVPSMS